jgi:tripartite-type tricarboxylate transporter receptor subunit TctC
MQRLGKQNLGGATGQQAADAVDKASQGKTLTPVQRKAMAAQATSVDKLASDPRTATQFRNLLNKINK